jgi:hypothetical protein
LNSPPEHRKSIATNKPSAVIVAVIDHSAFARDQPVDVREREVAK